MPLESPASPEHGAAIALTPQKEKIEYQNTHAAHNFKEKLASVADVNTTTDFLEDQDDEELRATKSMRQDAAGMRRMGKEQQLVRNFRQLSMTSFVAIATVAWELGIFVISPGLIDGGRSGLVYSTLWNFIGFAPVYLSMAEMASMAPIAGAQYHWVSEFAPESMQKPLSYLTGWTSTIAWQAGNALGIFIVGSLIQTMILINNENYAFPNWQGTLLACAAMVIAYIGNIYGSRILPYWQIPVFIIHILAYFAFIIPIWVKAPAATHSQVWNDFSNNGGWSSISLSIMIGQLSGIGQQTGIDTAAHMSEEVKNAAKTIPRTMLSVYVINMCLIFPAIITIVYHIPDLDAALDDSTTYPALYVLKKAVSVGWMTALMVVICLINMCSNIVYLAAVTRDLFAFSRDKGLPFSKWLSTVHPTRHIPVNAAKFTCVTAFALALIYVGSPVAFYAITALSTISLLQCYCLSISCVLWRRIALPGTLPPAQFSLGRWGIPVNTLAVVYSLWAFFWACWPQQTPVTAEGFNWASPIFVGVLLVALVYFVVKARRTYEGPVADVEGRKVA